MKRCEKHGVEMKEKERTIGWGSTSEPVCSICEEEEEDCRGFGSSSRVYPFLGEEALG